MLKERLVRSVFANSVGGPLLMLVELAASVLVARLLGPEMLATVVVIRALAQLAVAVSDVGLTNSVSKILTDLAQRVGRRRAIESVTKLAAWRAAIVPIVVGVAYYVDRAEMTEVGGGNLPVGAAGIAAVMASLSVLIAVRRSMILAAVRTREVLLVDTATAVVGPVLSVTAALAFDDPYAVAMTAVITQLAALAILRGVKEFDLPERAPVLGSMPLPLMSVLIRYRKYVAVNYAKFLFNKALIRTPSLVLILAVINGDRSALANAAIALSIVFQAWDVANLPLAQVRAPVISHLHATNAMAKIIRLEAVSMDVIVLTSGVAAICAALLAEPMILLLYGNEYGDAARWVKIGAVIALVGNIFSLGNNTLQQMEFYRDQVIGMVAGLTALGAGVFMLTEGGAWGDLGLNAVLLLISARMVFWLYTDLAADRRVSGWRSTLKKLRGVAAILIGLHVGREASSAQGMPAIAQALVVAVLAFWVVFRGTGGVADSTRDLVREILGSRWRGLARLL